jgi:hypothetical protein
MTSIVRLTATVAVVLCLLCGATGAARADLVERFRFDPLDGSGSNPFFGEGDTDVRFTHLPGELPRFPGDRKGTLRVLYDTTLPQARIAAPLGQVLSLDENIDFGAILTIRSEGFHATPDGFSQVAFGLWNSVTTGSNRTGFPADSFDLLEFDYFANMGAFGGPFLSPTVFGGNVSDNAFFNFAFQSSEVQLPLDVPLLCRLAYRALDRRLTVTVSRQVNGVIFDPIPGASANVDLSLIDPTFLVDSIGIAAYFEGFESLRAEVDYDLLYFGKLPAPFGAAMRQAGQ